MTTPKKKQIRRANPRREGKCPVESKKVPVKSLRPDARPPCSIETGIPFETSHYRYPFKDMKVGDSFFDPEDEDNTCHIIQMRMRNAIRYHKETRKEARNKTFVTRVMEKKVGNKLVKGVRCWRTA